MYDRAVRDLTFKVGSTPADVGPGSYDTEGKCKFRGDGYAPFLSMSSRDTCLNVSNQVVAAPGPGHYDITSFQDGPKGRGPLANKSKRFTDKVSDIPGPGAYHQYLEIGRKTKSAPGLGSEDRAKRMSNRVKFHRKPEAPSIPSQGQAFGYEECMDGTLKRQEPPTRDSSLGPAFYSPVLPESQSTKAYKGIHFGKLANRQLHSFIKSGPGPADYDPYLDRVSCFGTANMHVENNIRYESRLPRYYELIQQETTKKGVPGPGYYEVKSSFGLQAPILNSDGVEVEHPPFLSQSQRFTPLKSTVPAPGSYNNPITALSVLNRITGLKRSPFSQTSVRFESENPTKRTPGPGAYNFTGLGAESKKRAYMEATRKGVFGTTAPRSEAPRMEVVDLPSPAHYQMPVKIIPQRSLQPSANFASVTRRLSIKEKDVPPPDAYDVITAYERSQGKPTMAKPRSLAASRKHNSFMSAAARFVIFKDDNPGPGSYSIASESLYKKGGAVMTKEKRFRDEKEDFPGPGAYELSPLLQDTVLKGTFNHTLGNPVLPVPTTAYAQTNTKHPFLLGV